MLTSRSLRAHAALLLAFGAASATAQDKAAAPAARAAIPDPLGGIVPALANQSSWALDARSEGDKPDKAKRGVYPVGNGLVFGYQGLGRRANTLQALSGPDYRTEEDFAPKGNFGETSVDVTVGGKPVELPILRVRRVRGAGLVISEDAQENGLALRVLTFATPDSAVITRVIEVKNEGKAKVGEVAISVSFEGPVAGDGTQLTKVYDRPRHVRNLAAKLESGKAEGSALVASLGTLEPGASLRRVLHVATAAGKTGAAANPSFLQAGADADATVRWWNKRLESTTRFDTDHKKLKDLFEDWKVMALAQRDQASGLVVGMINRRGFSVRESVGPMLLFLRFNMAPEAKRILEYIYDATRLTNRVPDRLPLDLDFKALGDRQTNWEGVAVQPSEVPSWVILLHFWYWRITQDTDLIEKHWGLLEACLKKQRRDPDGSLMTFSGDEPCLHGAFHSLFPDRLPADPFLIAEDGDQGRHSFSLASGVMFLIAMQGMGELFDGLDKKKNPAAWAVEKPAVRPSQRYVERTFKIMEEIEKKYWLVEKGKEYFAPAVSPVTRQQHEAPCADLNLSPLWLGWTFPTGEKSRDNLRNSLARLPMTGTRVGMTPTVKKTTGFTQAMLLTALSERDCKDRLDALDEVLKLAEPAGEWGELYDEAGRPIASTDAEWPNRCRPWEGGVNLDALMFAITGIRCVAVPNWDNSDIRLELRMPHGASFLTLRDQQKDGRQLEIFMTEYFGRLTEDERKANEQKKPEERRDPAQDYRRLKFRVELVSPTPKRGYYDVGCNAMGTMFVRYLTKEMPISETEFWGEDKEVFLPAPDAKPPDLPWQPQKAARESELLFLASRTAGAELVGKEKVSVIDTGLPMTQAQLAAVLFNAKGEPSAPRLFVDLGADRPGFATMKTASFWSDPAWAAALDRYRKAGGQVLDAGYVRLDGDGKTEQTVIVNAVSDAEREVVLRIGASCSLSIKRSGTEVYTALAGGESQPDSGSVLLKLPKGSTALTVTMLPEGAQKVWLRISDARGLPIEGAKLTR